jgi:hypothetical protein
MPTGPSLSLELLRTIYPAPEAEQFAAWHEADPGTIEKKRAIAVMEGLYKALYNIIDQYDKPYNDALNRAIGRALALVIKDRTIGEDDPQFCQDRDSLIRVLKPVVAEAVKAVGQADPNRLEEVA